MSMESSIQIAALLDTTRFPWVYELIDFTVSLVNEGWFGDFLNGTKLEYSIDDADCDRHVAVRAFLNWTKESMLPNAILGCRCSSPTMAISSLAAALNIAVLSPASTNPQLSNKGDYPTFNRLVAPDNASGQAGALVSLLREFGWGRISIINTNTQYAQDFKVELIRSWRGEQEGFTGEIGYEGTVQVDQDTNKVDPESVKHVLHNAPVNNPSLNSRVVVLLAHHQHAFPILKIAREIGFQPDTTFIGAAWTGRAPEDPDTSWMPDVPGYIGVVPYRNFDAPIYKNFLRLLNEKRTNERRPPMENLPDSAADRTVDSVVALARALSLVPPGQRHNGTAVVDALRSLKFEGVSGTVEFDDNGDWANPRYTVMTLPEKGSNFIPIGTAAPGSVDIEMGKICYAQIGCGVNPPPRETDPIPSQVWQLALLVVLGATVCLFIPFACRLYMTRLPLKKKLKMLEEQIEGIDSNDGANKKKKVALFKDIARLLKHPRPTNWSEEQGLVNISPTETEYWEVFRKMRKTTKEDVWISKLSRVQNDGVWSYYVFRKNLLASKYGVDLNDRGSLCEIDAWHGTSSLNPDVITNDSHDGFMMNFSQQGLYGRGLYFAERFDYSDCYSYRVNNYRASFPDDSVIRQDDEDREIFLVKLLVGRAVEMNHQENEEECRQLLAAPRDETSNDGHRFDTVSGKAMDDTKIHTVYENGRAYPSYLIRYYKGRRDPTRTRFETEEEAMNWKKNGTAKTASSDGSSSDNVSDPDIRRGGSVRRIFNSLRLSSSRTSNTDPSGMDVTATDLASNYGDEDPGIVTTVSMNATDPAVDPSSGPSASPSYPVVDQTMAQIIPTDIEEGVVAATTGLWMFENDAGQYEPFEEEQQTEIEAAYRRDPRGSTTLENLKNSPWTYKIDFGSMTQTNLDHPDHRQRSINRMSID